MGVGDKIQNAGEEAAGKVQGNTKMAAVADGIVTEAVRRARARHTEET